MKYFPVTFILMAASETLLAAVMSGFSHLTNGQEVEENLIISRRRAAVEHDHRTDSPYVGIFSKSLTTFIIIYYTNTHARIHTHINIVKLYIVISK